MTPWTVLGQVRKLWDRTWRGGDLAIDKLGPKDAELEFVGWPLASSPYVRHAMRGVCEGMLALFCQKVYVREVPKNRKSAVTYRIGWV